MNRKADSMLDKFTKSYRESGRLWAVSLSLQNMGVPAFRFWPEKKFGHRLISRQTLAILRALGMPEEMAETAAGHINYSDLHGIDSHGCGMLRLYHRKVREGALVMNPRIEIIRQDETTALIDGGRGLGHITADMAMKLAIEKCRKTGLSAVAVRNSGHFGAAGAYAAMAADAGLIGMALTSIQEPAVVPTHGLQAMLGTNPISFGAPASRNRPFLLDMATSIAPTGRIVMAWRKGRFIPAGWSFNRRGKSLRNPFFALRERRLAPLGGSPEMGGYKGYGLAAMVEILTTLLPGCLEFESKIGHFFPALDPGRFGAPSAFRDNTDGFIDSLRATRPKNPRRPVQVAGDPEYQAASDRLENGIPLARMVIEDIRAVCTETGAPFLLDEQFEKDPVG